MSDACLCVNRVCTDSQYFMFLCYLEPHNSFLCVFFFKLFNNLTRSIISWVKEIAVMILELFSGTVKFNVTLKFSFPCYL